MKHIAVIPARMGSVGFKHKNRILFDYTARFLTTHSWFERVIVSTDDPVVAERAENNAFSVHHRPPELAGPDVSIHQVFAQLIPDMAVSADDILWLFYLPVLYKDIVHFATAREVIEAEGHDSLCTFVPAESHPYACWRHDEQQGRLSQYIENDCYRRQDLPPAWTHYHYVYCFRAGAINRLNSEMINGDTYPLFLDETVRDTLIEIDTPEQFERWKKMGRPMGNQ